MEGLAAGVQKGLARFLINLFEGLEAIRGEAGAQHVDPLDAALRECDERRLGVGLQPFGAAEAALERDEHVVLADTEPLAKQARGLEALAVVRIAERQGAPRHAVEAQHQLVGSPVQCPVVVDALRERADVAGVVVVVVDEAHLGQVANFLRPLVDRVVHACGRRRRVLRVQRQDEHARHALGLQRVEHRGRRGVAVAHRVAHRDGVTALAQVSAQQLGLLLGPDFQRRALLGPDARVLLRRLRRPRAQDHAVQDQPPENPRDLDHAPVGEELGEVTSHRGRRGRVGRAEVAQQHRGARWGAMLKRRFGGECHAVQGFTSNSGGGWRWVSANLRISKRTHGLAGSEGDAPRPMVPLPCSVQLPRRRPMISGSWSNRT